MTKSDLIRIRGARTHNLKNINVDIPVGQMTVITGLSGSGKSSLAHNTMFAEGQRRYLESVSVQTHQMMRSLRRPDVDEVSGLPPTVSVDQRVTLAPARSTVAVTTDIYDYLRLLFARSGVVHCTTCNRPVQCQTIDEVVQQLLQFPERSRLMLLAPLVRDQRGSHRQIMERVARHGLVRVRVNGELLDLSEVPDLNASERHSVDAVVDRLILKAGVESRIQESVSLAVRESGDACIVSVQTDGNWQDHFFNTRHSCPECEISFPEPDPGLFSFNTGRGACADCEGLGVKGVADDSAETIVFRRHRCETCRGSRLQDFPSRVRFGHTTLPEFTGQSVAEAHKTVQRWQQRLQSSETLTSDNFAIRSAGRAAAVRILPDMERRLASLIRVGLDYLTLDRSTRSLSGGEYQRARLASCLGSDVHGACYVLDEPTNGLHPQDTERLLRMLFELRDAGATLVIVEHDPDVTRAADHVIDLGPGAGSDGGKLLYAGPPSTVPDDTATGRALTSGASFAVADTETAETRESASLPNRTYAHHGSGQNIFSNEKCYATKDGPVVVPGGRNGNTQDSLAAASTARTLHSAGCSDPGESHLIIRGAALHNLQDVTVSIPLMQFVCVAGVSGSGKSSLICRTLFPVAHADGDPRSHLTAALVDVECRAIDGLDNIDRVAFVDSRPVSRSRRSCLATHCGVWNDVRGLFASTREARARGISAARFSFNSGSGRCSECKGIGVQDVRMNLLPDAEVPCQVCGGQRFSREILSIRFANRTVSDVLNLRVDEALDVFSEINSIVGRLRPFQQVGLGYMPLGQSASTFSGGEAQRVRLATELIESMENRILYILDEPTRGLHHDDVARLLNVLRGFVDRRHSVIVIEHNIQVIRAADWIIELGPGAAADGGRVIAEGTPDLLRDDPDSVTGRWL